MIKNTIKSDKGNVSVFTALLLVPIMAAMGVVFDLSRLFYAKSDFQNIADSAALAGALAYMQEGENAMELEGERSLEANAALHTDISVKSFQIEKTDDNTVYVEVDLQTNPMFMQMFGQNEMDFTVTANVSVAGSSIGAEVAIAIDATNSMAFGTSWDDALDTASNILDDMKGLSSDGNFYVTLVPFQDRVNIGTALRASWITANGQYDWDEWNGCIEPREQKVGAFDWMLTDDKPSSDKFVPFITDSEYPDGRLIRCPSNSITGPTNDVDEIIDEIKKLTPSGTGRYDLGLAWAWRALSPNWKGQWGVSNYPSENSNGKDEDDVRKKYIIYMTDGLSNAFKLEAMMEQSWDYNEGSQQAFEHIAELCQNIKDQDIEIYMLQIPGNDYSTPYFKGCASSADHYFLIDEAKDINMAFNNIKQTLSDNIRIVR